jgi:hypothetical protein
MLGLLTPMSISDDRMRQSDRWDSDPSHRRIEATGETLGFDDDAQRTMPLLDV